MKNNSLVSFLFEAATLKRLKRTGWQILGGNDESIAEHSYMVTVIGYLLSVQVGANREKVLVMSLFHDFSEARTGDVYKLADLYTSVDEEKAIDSGFEPLGKMGRGAKSAFEEYRENKTIEAKIIHDADTLALCLELKILYEHGNYHAREWLDANIKRLKLPESQKLGKDILNTDSQDWWKKERDLLHLKMNGVK